MLKGACLLNVITAVNQCSELRAKSLIRPNALHQLDDFGPFDSA